MQIVFTLLCASFVAVGILLCVHGFRALRRDQATARWPQVTGRITRSEVVSGEDSEGTTMYKPAIRYRYTVDGQVFDGEDVFLTKPSTISSAWLAGGHVRRYPAGAEVRVAYEPEQPEVSVLQTGVALRSFYGLIFGLGFAIMGAWLLLRVGPVGGWKLPR